MKETIALAGSRSIVPEAMNVAWIGVQVGVIVVLARAFHLESPAFYGVVLPLALGGFLVHHWLPRGYQPWFFAALSLAGIGLVFGPVAGAWLVGVGLGLIALCHLPIAFRWRVVLVLLAAGALVAMRSAWLSTPWPSVIWPVLGSMFMFRLAIYLYDLKHRGPSGPGFVLSYFFLLPNTVFLLFPVIDFQTFRRTHYDKPAFFIYSEGIRWMFRGLTHLVIYRLIYQYVALSPTEVTSTASLTQYLVGNYGLYLRVSGQFHMIVGLLHLFGFRLPETHRFFYLASSFSDLWRRINIYWKDFMQKMVYLPVMFGLKARGETTALVGATIAVVGATWFLHSYQWFWLLGTWLFSATDIVFWGILGLLLVGNTLREQRRGRERQLTAQTPPPHQAWRHAIQTAGMFALMAVLWGFWTSPTLEDFGVVLRGATLRPIDVVAVLGTLSVVAAAAFLTRRFSMGAPSALGIRPRWQHPLVVSALPLALFWVLGEPTLEGRVPAQVQAVAQQARLVELNKNDAERLQQGYYEQIVGVNRFNGQLWELYARAERAEPVAEVGPAAIADGRAGLDAAPMAQQEPNEEKEVEVHGNPVVGQNNELQTQLNKNFNTVYKGGRMRTNRWGMRDKDYQLTPPPASRRIAVLGPSYVFGSGVNDGETFEQLVEDRLNRELSSQSGLHYEFLNFAVPGYTLMQQTIILSNGRVGAFQPDAVVMVGHPSDMRTIAGYVWKELRAGRSFAAPVDQVLRTAGMTADMPQAEATRRLSPYAGDLAKWALTQAATEIRRMGAQAVYAIVPMPVKSIDQRAANALIALAQTAGFLTVDMGNVFQNFDVTTLIFDEADRHPNAEGHRIVARRLHEELTKMPGLLAADTAAEARRKATVRADWNREDLARKKAAEVMAAKPAVPIEGWSVETPDGGVARLESSRKDNWMRVTISRLPTSSSSHVKVRSAPVPIVDGHRYVLTVWIKADGTRPVGFRVAQRVAPGELLGESTELQATTWWQEHSCSFTATGTDSDAQIMLDLGTSSTAVELSNIQLKDLSTGEVVFSTDPAWRRSSRTR